MFSPLIYLKKQSLIDKQLDTFIIRDRSHTGGKFLHVMGRYQPGIPDIGNLNIKIVVKS